MKLHHKFHEFYYIQESLIYVNRAAPSKFPTLLDFISLSVSDTTPLPLELV